VKSILAPHPHRRPLVTPARADRRSRFGRTGCSILGVVAVLCFSLALPTRVCAQQAVPALPTSTPPVPVPTAETTIPGLDTNAKEPTAPPRVRRWWFWTAVGLVAGATVTVAVLSSRGSAPPATDLGNQKFQP
jgi:hypothetical protein